MAWVLDEPLAQSDAGRSRRTSGLDAPTCRIALDTLTTPAFLSDEGNGFFLRRSDFPNE